MPLPLIPLAIGLASQFAPDVIRWIGGEKAGDVAQQVVDIGAKITGTSDPEEMARRLAENQGLRLRFDADMAALSASLEKAYLADVQNARARDIRLAELGRTNWRAHLMVGGAFVSLITCILVIAVGGLPETVNNILNNIAVACTTLLALAFNYEFGSSRGSAEKSAQLAAQKP